MFRERRQKTAHAECFVLDFQAFFKYHDYFVHCIHSCHKYEHTYYDVHFELLEFTLINTLCQS